ncbi:MAG: hypothetical protein K0Q87_3096 [Neobacillus sp.]|jgi:uncharacterized protein (TIRG00374 family)|nr:hypothetical protein [Neobacillus sp.]
MEQIEMKKHKLNNSKLILWLIACVVIYIAFLFWGDLSSIGVIIRTIPTKIYVISLLVVFFGFFIKSIKLLYTLMVLNIKVSFKDSLFIFFIGTAFVITPGKLGELIKPYLIKRKFNIEMSRTIPIIFSDHLSAFIAWIVFIAMTIAAFSIGYAPILILILILVAGISFLQSKSFFIKLIEKVTSLSFLQKYRPSILNLYLSTYDLLKIKPLLITTSFAAAGCLTECIPLYLILKSLDIDIAFGQSTFIVGIGTVAGTMSMLPGGIGVNEISVVGLLMHLGLDKSLAVSVSLIERLFILWSGVVIGLAVLLFTRKRYFK